MSIYEEKYLDFSIKINEHISAVMLSTDTNVRDYHYQLFWDYAVNSGVVIRNFRFNGSARSRISGMIVRDTSETTIAVNSNMSPRRINFTVSHELIHFFYHMSEENHYFTDTKDSLNYTDIDILPEFQANIGASAILLPEPVLIYHLKQGTSPIEMINQFGISEPALRMRLIHTMQAEFEASYVAAQKTANKILTRYSCGGRPTMIELGKNLEKKIIYSNPFYEAICI